MGDPENREIDILHPLADLQTVKIHSARQHQTYKPLQNYGIVSVLLFNSTLYVQSRFLSGFHLLDVIRCASIDSDLGRAENWTQLTPPEVVGSVLTTYRSQLVMVGGRELYTPEAGPLASKVFNDLWASTDGTDWQKSLPPMPTCSFGATAVKTECPEILVVIGGIGEDGMPVNVIEMLRDGEWSSVRIPPGLCHSYNILSTLHNGNLYIKSFDSCHFCRFNSLLSALSSPDNDSEEDILWSVLPQVFTRASQRDHTALLSLGQQLVALNEEGLDIHSPFTDAWIRVLDSFSKYVTLDHGLVLPNGEFMMFVKNDVIRAKLTVLPYTVDGKFSKHALARLEATGTPVLSLLERLTYELGEAVGVAESEHEGMCPIIIYRWDGGRASRPNTWREFYEVLGELGLEELSHRIQERLSCPQSLKEQCTSVITSVLLQQWSLEPDQLHVRLPDYVPPAVKRSLTHAFRVHTHQLSPSPSPTPSPPPHKKFC